MSFLLFHSCCLESGNQMYGLRELDSGSLFSCPTRLWTTLPVKVQLRARKDPAMELDGLAFCSWLLIHKFKISPIINTTMYYKLSLGFFFFFSACCMQKSSYCNLWKKLCQNNPNHKNEQRNNIRNNVYCFFRQAHKIHEILRALGWSEADWSYSSWKVDFSQWLNICMIRRLQ